MLRKAGQTCLHLPNFCSADNIMFLNSFYKKKTKHDVCLLFFSVACFYFSPVLVVVADGAAFILEKVNGA